jgi:hypothetical protein
MKVFIAGMTLLALSLMLPQGEALAAGSGREAPQIQPSNVPSAEQAYSRGLVAKNAKSWSVAALEYLGEAYVRLGRMDDARKVLERLKPLDAGRAAELSEVIEKGK